MDRIRRHQDSYPDQHPLDALPVLHWRLLRRLTPPAVSSAGPASKYNRAYETAVAAGFEDIEKSADITEGGLVVSPNENGRRAEAFRTMLGTKPKPGTNTIVVTHKPNIIDAFGKD